MSSYLIDTHAHINWEKLAGREEEVVKAALDAGVKKILTIGCCLETSKKSQECAEKFENVFFSVGIHPCDVKKETNWDEFEALLSHSKCKAVGECGFDFYYTRDSESVQEEAFVKQIELSKKYKLPLIIHTRDAGDKTLEFLKKYKVSNFVVHCFTETPEFAKEIIKLGGMSSFGGIITYPKADSVREALSLIPIENIMLETDCPFLAPQSVRGKTNEPKYVPEIAEKVAELRGMSFEEVAKVTTKNAESFFNI
ncbi:TatD family hydrolase [Candidatus Peregrinibacteria bacterium]|jgi:TatD DNase family protein|nr:TatD family hydrolase [Candidatus Peregrinibacteria bacterium]